MGEQVPHIFQQGILGLVMLQDTDNVKKQRTLCRVLKAQALPGLRESLARKSGTQDVVGGDNPGIDFADVSVRFYPVVGKVGFPAVFIDVAGEDALPAQGGHGLMKTADPAKQIYESELLHTYCCLCV